jgi:hypothetical protein
MKMVPGGARAPGVPVARESQVTRATHDATSGNPPPTAVALRIAEPSRTWLNLAEASGTASASSSHQVDRTRADALATVCGLLRTERKPVALSGQESFSIASDASGRPLVKGTLVLGGLEPGSRRELLVVIENSRTHERAKAVLASSDQEGPTASFTVRVRLGKNVQPNDRLTIRVLDAEGDAAPEFGLQVGPSERAETPSPSPVRNPRASF